MVRFKNFVLLCVIIAVLIGASFFYSEPMFLFFSGGLIFSVAFSVILTYFSSKKIKIMLKSEKDFVDKDFVNDIIAEIYAGGILSFVNAKFNFYIENGFYNKKCYFTMFSSLKRGNIKIPVKSEHCGKISVFAESVVMADLFNIIAFKKSFNEKCIFYVLPNDSSEMVFVQDTQKSGTGEETSSEVSANGDIVTGAVQALAESNMKNIHWKMTVKKNMLMLKEFAESCSNDKVLLIAIYDEFEKTNKAFEIAKAVAFSLISQNKVFYVSFFDEKSEMPFKIYVENENDFFMAYRALCDEGKPTEDKAFNFIESISTQAQVFYIGKGKNNGEIKLSIY